MLTRQFLHGRLVPHAVERALRAVSKFKMDPSGTSLQSAQTGAAPCDIGHAKASCARSYVRSETDKAALPAISRKDRWVITQVPELCRPLCRLLPIRLPPRLRCRLILHGLKDRLFENSCRYSHGIARDPYPCSKETGHVELTAGLCCTDTDNHRFDGTGYRLGLIAGA